MIDNLWVKHLESIFEHFLHVLVCLEGKDEVLGGLDFSLDGADRSKGASIHLDVAFGCGSTIGVLKIDGWDFRHWNFILKIISLFNIGIKIISLFNIGIKIISLFNIGIKIIGLSNNVLAFNF